MQIINLFDFYLGQYITTWRERYFLLKSDGQFLGNTIVKLFGIQHYLEVYTKIP